METGQRDELKFVSHGAEFALKAGDGSPLWSYALLGIVYSDLVVDGTTVYVGADNGITYALQADTGVLRWYYLTKVSN